MPKVGKRKFAYTEKGKKAAKRYAANLKKEKYKIGGVVKKNKSKRSRKR